MITKVLNGVFVDHKWSTVRRLGFVMFVWWCSLDLRANNANQLAAVLVNEPGHWQPFHPGALVASPNTGTGPSTYWTALPEILMNGNLEHYYLEADQTKSRAEEYGLLDFEVLTDGTIWMLTTARFANSGNSSGDWLPELTTRQQLEAEGWRIVVQGVEAEYGYEAFGGNENLLDWILFERASAAGDQFSIRTEKYQSPILFRTASVSSGEIVNGLIAYYPLDGNALDASGHGIDGQVFNVLPTTNRYGQAGAALNFHLHEVLHSLNVQGGLAVLTIFIQTFEFRSIDMGCPTAVHGNQGPLRNISVLSLPSLEVF